MSFLFLLERKWGLSSSGSDHGNLDFPFLPFYRHNTKCFVSLWRHRTWLTSARTHCICAGEPSVHVLKKVGNLFLVWRIFVLLCKLSWCSWNRFSILMKCGLGTALWVMVAFTSDLAYCSSQSLLFNNNKRYIFSSLLVILIVLCWCEWKMPQKCCVPGCRGNYDKTLLRNCRQLSEYLLIYTWIFLLKHWVSKRLLVAKKIDQDNQNVFKPRSSQTVHAQNHAWP